MYCSKCGTKISDDSQFCSKCGTQSQGTQIQINHPLTNGSTSNAQYYSTQSGQLNAPGSVASLVCGLIGIIFFGIVLGIIAIVMGTKAKSKISAQPGVYGGAGLATAGIVLGIIDIVGFFFWLPLYV